MKAFVAIVLIIILFIVTPIFAILSLNLLFNLDIAVGFWEYLSMFYLLALISPNFGFKYNKRN